jgi:hypothetical protein
MKTSSLLAVLLVSLLAGACAEEAPEPEYTRPPEYRNDAAEFLLSEQAKTAQSKRERREKEATVLRTELRSKLNEVPADFPVAFTRFPGAEWRNGFSAPPVTMVALSVSEPAGDAFERLQKAAEVDGWTLEIVTHGDDGPQASFQKDSRRVEVLVSRLDDRTQVVALLTDLEQPPASSAN